MHMQGGKDAAYRSNNCVVCLGDGRGLALCADVGDAITSMWMCPRTTTTTDMRWYLALFPGMGMFGSGMGYTCDEDHESTGGQL